MSNLIEQAAQRLAQLREAGVEIPGDAPVAASPAAPPAQGRGPVPTAPRSALAPQVMSKAVELDLETLAAASIVTPNAPRTRMADQFRVIKRPLIANYTGKGAAPVKDGNLIMVTSALAGEGKTFTSINLAMSIAAELDHSVMLVDADVARPSILRTLGLPPGGPGLLDVLEGKASIPDALLRTNVEKLTLMPSGTPHLRATELLASDAMNELLSELASRYADRIIIFDSPPLLLTTESRALASHMGQIVVVVHAGRTLQADVQQALSTIETCPVRMMMLNKARASADAHGYGYGYGYGYSYGSGYGRGSGYGGPGSGAARQDDPTAAPPAPMSAAAPERPVDVAAR